MIWVNQPVLLEIYLRRRRWPWVVAGVLPLVTLLSLADHRGWFLYPGSDHARYDGRHATVVDAIDGDTLKIDIPDGSQPTTSVKLLGDSAPGNGQESREFIRHTARGQTVRLTLPPPGGPGGGQGRTRDPRGMLLAYVELPDGQLLNETLLTAGLVRADVRLDHPRFDQFAELERQARHNHAGLWGHPLNRPLRALRRETPSENSPAGAAVPASQPRETNEPLRF